MGKYLCLQRSLSDQPDEASSSAQTDDFYEKFNAWREEFSDNLDDLGGKLGDATLVTTSTDTAKSTVEVNKLAGGYMIVTAENMDQAVEVASSCPGLVTNRSGVEIIEIEQP